jgi:hypothetical protein
MGRYDSYLTRCPDCGAQIEFQTKAGDGGGQWEYYSADTSIVNPEHSTASVRHEVPEWMRADLEDDELTCRACGRRVKLDAQMVPQRMLNRGRKFDEP